MLDNKGHPFWLLLKDETEMENLFLHAEIEEAPFSVQEALRNRNYLPYFHTENRSSNPAFALG